MAYNYQPGGAWHYTVYNPAGSTIPTYNFSSDILSVPNNAPHLDPPSTTEAPDTCEAMYSASLKVLNPSNKKEFTVFRLINLMEVDLSTPTSLKKAIIAQVDENVVSKKLDFPVGYYHKSAKLWLNNMQDGKDALDVLKQSGRLTFWCMGLGKDHTDSDQESEGEDSDEPTSKRPAKKRKRSTLSEKRASCVNELKTELCQNHGSKYSNVQYALWAEIIVGETHDSLDEPPPVPMFGAQRPRGRSSVGHGNLADALTDVADKIASAISPAATQACSSSGKYSSPTKSELRGKYIQQLKEMVNLRHIGALTEEEYDEQRSVVVNLMRKLST